MATLKQIAFENLAFIAECTKPCCYKLKFRYGYCEKHAEEWEKYLAQAPHFWAYEYWGEDELY